MALPKINTLVMRRTYKITDLPCDTSMKTLRRILELEQQLWSTQYRNLANHEESPTPESTLYFIGGVALNENSMTAFAINELRAQGWLAEALVDQALARVALPQFVPYTEALAGSEKSSEVYTGFALAFRLLLCQHQRLLWTVINNDFAKQSAQLPALVVGSDIPVDLAILLTKDGLANCYEGTDVSVHFGSPVEAVDGALITLTVQDFELAENLREMLLAQVKIN
jgi:hypothetical protein